MYNMFMGRDILWPFSKALKPNDAILCVQKIALLLRGGEERKEGKLATNSRVNTSMDADT
jgi:hypothetical protein